jgi:hypothetical protein
MSIGLHRWLRRWLWSYAISLAAVVALGWAFGSLSSGWHVVEVAMVALTASVVAVLVAAGLLDWRRRRNGGNGNGRRY